MWFNPAAFANPGAGTFGDAGRNTLIGPGFANVNLSLAKEFRLHEAITLDVRADAYNMFNHISWANPDANVGYGGAPCANGPNAGIDLADCTAGQITSPVGGTRIIQLGGHVRF
jgi:hypothetical protein